VLLGVGSVGGAGSAGEGAHPASNAKTEIAPKNLFKKTSSLPKSLLIQTNPIVVDNLR
jgi:hypothetical protein